MSSSIHTDSESWQTLKLKIYLIKEPGLGLLKIVIKYTYRFWILAKFEIKNLFAFKEPGLALLKIVIKYTYGRWHCSAWGAISLWASISSSAMTVLTLFHNHWIANKHKCSDQIILHRICVTVNKYKIIQDKWNEVQKVYTPYFEVVFWQIWTVKTGF